MLKFATTEVRVVQADNSVVLLHRDEVAAAIAGCQVARIITRKRDGAITRVFAKASPGEIAPRSHRTATVVQDLPNTWSPNPRYYAHSAA